MSAYVFDHDDAGWLAWAAENPDGLVLNTYATYSPGYFMLHKATCRTITAVREAGAYTARDYRKVIGPVAALSDFATRKGGTLKRCGICKP